MKKDAKYYASLLPQRLSVKIEKDDNGLWARINELSHCYTQAANATQLIEMINDTVQTHFEIPEQFSREVGYYIPLSAEHLKLEGMFRKLIEIDQKASAGFDVEETLNLSNSLVC